MDLSTVQFLTSQSLAGIRDVPFRKEWDPEKRRSSDEDSGLADTDGSGGLQPSGNASRARTLYYIAAAVLAALIPLILFAGFWVRAVLDQSQRDLESRLIMQATSQSARLDTEIRHYLSLLQALASLPSLDAPDLNTFRLAADRMLAAGPSWTGIILADPRGAEVLKTLRAPELDLPDVAESAISRRVAQEGGPVVSTFFSEAGGARPTDGVLLSVPVIRDQAVRFVLSAVLSTDRIQQLLAEVPRDQHLTVVADDDDRILARSREFDQVRGKPLSEQFRTTIAGRSSGLAASRTLEGQDVVTAFQRSPMSGWVTIAATDRRYLEALTERSTLTMILAGTLSLTLAGVLAAFVSYNVVERRISDERLATSRVVGELDARLLETTQEALAAQRKSASEREVLLREIYHRVKNNLQIIQSLLRLGSRDLNEDQREPFESAIRRIGAMAKVHSLLYESADLASIDLKHYLEELLKEIAESFGANQHGIRTELRVAPMRVALDTAVPLAFIAVEIITNAFKHAFPDRQGGVVSISVDREGDHGVLAISDSGIGIPEARGSQRLLGLNLVRKLVEQISGILEAPAPGSSTYRILFPLVPAGPSERPQIQGSASPDGAPPAGA